MSDPAHIIGGPVDADYDGAVLTADLSLGDTVLHVDDTADFDEDASTRDALLSVGLDIDTDGTYSGGTSLAYTTCDDDAGTVTLVAASTATASTGDKVYLLDPVSGAPVGRLEVQVAMDDADTTGDPLSAYLDIALLESVGDLDLTDLAVDVDEDEDGQLYIAGFPGLIQRQGRVRGHQDFATATGSGNLTINLTHRPLPDETLHVKWRGVDVPDAQWALSTDRWSVTIQDGNGIIKSGDLCWAKYLYDDPATRPTTPASLFLVGSTLVTNGATSIGLPSGTLSGDLMVLSLVSRSGSACSCADSRFFYSQAGLSGVGQPSTSVWLGIGTADGSGSAVSITLPAGFSSASRAMLTVFRTTGTVSHTFSAIQTAPSGFSPTMPAGVDLGIVALVAENNVVAAPIIADTGGHWTTVSYGVNSNNTGQSATLTAYSLAGMPAGLWTGLETAAVWAALAIGLTEA